MTAPLLSVDGVSMRFGALSVLEGVTFDVDEHQIFGLIGPNGAGKTTLFNCISGLYRPNDGSISYRGQRIDALPVHRRSRLGIARTFQNLNLFGGLSVQENLMVPVEVRDRHGVFADAFRLPTSRFGEIGAAERARAILHLLGLLDQAERRADDLPVGLQRRVEIGRALAQRPDLLLLDEPASGLDARETAELAEILPILRDRLQITIILVDHDMALVLAVCERICALDFGQVLMIGTSAEVRNDERVIASYLGRAHT
ncbi:MAG: ABC transporter ATP-binding protein [Acidimicrobiales bacterium]